MTHRFTCVSLLALLACSSSSLHVSPQFGGLTRFPLPSGPCSLPRYARTMKGHPMSVKCLVAAALTLLGVAIAPLVNAQSYSFTDLGGTSGIATGINNSGEVAGTSAINSIYYSNATVWYSTVPTYLAPLGGGYVWSEVHGINSTGEVVGATNSNGAIHATLWYSGNTADLGTLSGTVESRATGINDSGQIVGWSQDFNSAIQHPTLWDGTSILDLGTLGGAGGEATAVNKLGQVAGSSSTGDGAAFHGTHATLWDGSSVTDLGTLGGRDSAANGINDAEQVVGWSQVAGNTETHATFWDGSTVIDLGGLGGDYSVATGINNRAQVVGYSNLAGNVATHATFWNGATLVDLNSLIDPNLGWTLTYAMDINDAGQIVGQAIYQDQQHAFLLTPCESCVIATPVPEPETYAMMLLGLGVVGFAARRRKKA